MHYPLVGGARSHCCGLAISFHRMIFVGTRRVSHSVDLVMIVQPLGFCWALRFSTNQDLHTTYKCQIQISRSIHMITTSAYIPLNTTLPTSHEVVLWSILRFGDQEQNGDLHCQQNRWFDRKHQKAGGPSDSLDWCSEAGRLDPDCRSIGRTSWLIRCLSINGGWSAGQFWKCDSSSLGVGSWTNLIITLYIYWLSIKRFPNING